MIDRIGTDRSGVSTGAVLGDRAEAAVGVVHKVVTTVITGAVREPLS
jgi:hypothetical protein